MTRRCREISVGLGTIGLLLAAGCSQRIELAQVTPEAMKTLKTTFPRATVTEVKRQYVWGLKVYEAELKQGDEFKQGDESEQGDKEIEVKLSLDGVIIEVEAELLMEEVPPAVAKAITEAAKGSEVTEIERVDVLGKIESGKVVKLSKPKVFYEAEYRKLGLPVKIKVGPDGSRL